METHFGHTFSVQKCGQVICRLSSSNNAGKGKLYCSFAYLHLADLTTSNANRPMAERFSDGESTLVKKSMKKEDKKLQAICQNHLIK